MIPSKWIFLDSFPLSKNGKIDRKQLPKFETIDNEELITFILPSNIVEQQLYDIYLKCFTNTLISIHSDFFTDLGGNSLIIMKLISLIQNTFNIIITFDIIMKYTSISTLSIYLTNHLNDNNNNSIWYS